MFGIGMPELIVILVIALIVLGPQKLPEIARSLGKGLNELKKASDDFRNHLDEDERQIGERERLAREAAEKEAALAKESSTAEETPASTPEDAVTSATEAEAKKGHQA